ncbi:MAG: squalene/phytoene synthase family protein [Pseudomonadota bacterium]
MSRTDTKAATEPLTPARARETALAAAEPDGYLAGLFAPAERRDAFWAVYGFAHEIERVRRAVSEPMLGEIRLQWWRETLDGVFAGAPRRHETALALHQATGFGLLRAPLDRLIDARAFDLYETPMPDLAALEAYCADVFGGPMAACANVLDERGASGLTAQLAREAGIAYGLARLVADLASQLGLRQVFAPEAILRDHGARPEDIVNRAWTPAVQAALQALREASLRRLEAAKPLLRRAPSAIAPAFLPAALTAGYLRASRRAGERLFEAPVRPAPLSARFAYFRAALLGRL